MTRIFFLLAFCCISLVSGASSQSLETRQYSSSDAGYKVDFPADWSATEEWVWPVAHLYLSSPGVRDRDVTMSAGISICSQPKGYVSTSSNSNGRCRLRDDHLSDLYKNKVVSEEWKEIGGVKFRKVVSEDKYRPDTTFIDAFFSTPKRDVIVSAGFPSRFNLDRYIPVFDQVIASIQNLENVKQITFSSQKLGFSISYPTSWRSCAMDFRRKKDDVLHLVPEDKLCTGANSILIALVADKSGELAQQLSKENFLFSQPEWATTNLISGSKTFDAYFYRNTYLGSRDDISTNSLLVKEMYVMDQQKYRNEAVGILRSINK